MKFCLLLILFTTSVGWAQRYQDDMSPLSSSFHASKRKALQALMPDNSVAIFFASEHKTMSNDILYAYHPNPDFYYLTGVQESNAALLLFKSKQSFGDSLFTDAILFVEENDPTEEIWEGKRLGVEGAKSQLAFEHVYPSTQFSDILPGITELDEYLVNIPEPPINDNPRNKGDLFSMVKHLEMQFEANEIEYKVFALKESMARLRQQKSKEELDLIRRACQITTEAQNELMRAIKPEMNEYQAQAIVEYSFAVNGAEKRAFRSICGAGNNACVLHYSANRKPFGANDLILVDIGAEYHGYAADITRTFPVSGKFSPEQKKLYELVLKAQRAGIDKCRVGLKFQAPHDRCVQVLAQGLMQLGIIEKHADVYDYYMHGTSHYMGLDVHDAGLHAAFKTDEVVTVEPGIYIPEGSPCDKKWWGIGIRIEDDIRITYSGPEILSSGSPVEVDEIEKLMQEAPTMVK